MAPLDISLGVMIKKNRRNTNKRGRGKPFGAHRKNPLGVNARTSAIAKSIRRTNNLRSSGLDVGTKLYISNLDVGVTNEDIRELFLGIGELIRYAIHFDKNGRPNGSAEVVFARRSDALQALKRYNMVELDGKPMKMEVIGSNPKTPISARINVGGANGKYKTVVVKIEVIGSNPKTPISARINVGGANGKYKTVVMASAPAARSRGGFTRFNRGYVRKARCRVRGGGVRGRGGARRATRRVEISADDLDKELERYHAEAMQS